MSFGDEIPLAVEDKFVIIGIQEIDPGKLTHGYWSSEYPDYEEFYPRETTFNCDDSGRGDTFRPVPEELIRIVSQLDNNYIFVLDACGLLGMYNEIGDFIHGLIEYRGLNNIAVLAQNEFEKKLFESCILPQSAGYIGVPNALKIHYLTKNIPQLKYTHIDVSFFEPDFEEEETDVSRLNKIVNSIGRNSLLNEFAFTINKNKITYMVISFSSSMRFLKPLTNGRPPIFTTISVIDPSSTILGIFSTSLNQTYLFSKSPSLVGKR